LTFQPQSSSEHHVPIELLQQPPIDSGVTLQRSPTRAVSVEEQMSVLTTPQKVTDAVATCTIDEVEQWLNDTRDTAPLADRLVAPFPRLREAIIDIYRRGPFGYDVDLSRAVFREADLPRLAETLAAGRVDCLTVEAYPTEEWIAENPHVSGMGIVAFAYRKFFPVFDHRARTTAEADIEMDFMPNFSVPRVAPPHVDLSDLLHAALITEENTQGTLKQRFAAAQERVWRSLPSQPTVTQYAGRAFLRFTRLRADIQARLCADQSVGRMSLAHIVSDFPTTSLPSPCEWFVTEGMGRMFGGFTAYAAQPLAAITHNETVCGIMSPLGCGLNQREFDDAWPVVALRNRV
jgi:hypothetical protein